MTNLGRPNLEIIFKGIGASAVQRGQKGNAILIVKDDTKGENHLDLHSITDVDTKVEEQFTKENIQYIKDVLGQSPRMLQVVRLSTAGNETEEPKEPETKGAKKPDLNEDDIFFLDEDSKITSLASALDFVDSIANSRNSWIALADATKKEQGELNAFVLDRNKYANKRYKTVGHDIKDGNDIRIVNFVNSHVIFNDIDDEDVKEEDKRGVQEGVVAIPYLLGVLASGRLDQSLIARTLGEFDNVSKVKPLKESDKDIDSNIADGQFILEKNEGKVEIVRAVNSLNKTGEGLTDDMRSILVVEVMDLIYTDIVSTWNDSYKGLYKNSLDNQMLLVSAINSYFDALEDEGLLDPNYDNRVEIDINKQRQVNQAKYGEDEVSGWADERVREMTYGTDVFLRARVKILDAMEDLTLGITMV